MLTYKETLRSDLRQRRWDIPVDTREEMSRRICQALSQVVHPCDTVLVYCAKEPEVETSWFIEDLLLHQRKVIVPIIESANTGLRLSYINSRDILKPSTFCVPEPVGCELPADPSHVTCAVIPMLGFDKKGGRIGYGAGYYDRFLSRHPHIRKIGIAYSVQEVPEIPSQEHDIRMDIIVTEITTYRCQ
ncbi:MAG TPA: 5-formyltetrahydrofolate cyclo-ligase [Methanospirillum sp.]|jgi:5-formyltetrahydrofolate cyclo-ligase|uniref:5-formyltetrahydrofolate cyclo-ligase n=1 Tax=Methanospirillum sp. TaxID=45200 RepID=UPI0009CB56E6|nr:5-formyltetrahydrofolate cyclo-ligase [Methanospirillum sp.]NLL10074.1 5-formyltetrahydrofolate cyclo-ligase [Methanomicrobiales archaeon]OQB38620.1 MAG: 5-formyltetrahydrofolate cyclo-ligase family protein [Euryarchaeota archaeon ADurb.Bin165]HPY59427.1 5-formyltetrahydrofolate cyclo-ligase [Methanospirillum sp.]